MTLLKELQQITERTYGHFLGINLEEFIIGKKRFEYLSEMSTSPTKDLSDAARVFFRILGERLYLAIYFSNRIITTLEANDPRKGLSEKNIHPFIVFFEEINHGVHTALKFSRGKKEIRKEEFIRDLELLAKVDTYQILKFFVAYFNGSGKLEKLDRLWLRHHLFERSNFSYEHNGLSDRYREANRMGEKYTRFLDGISEEGRLGEMRRFREMNYPMKTSYIRMLP